MNQAVFLDRDGTLIEEKHYLSRPEDVVLFPGAGAALKRLQDRGFRLFIVSNQSGVGRGYFTMAEVERVNRRLLELLGQSGVLVERIYIAPEAPDAPSRGRKPSPQFLFDARDEFGVELGQSYMIGDKLIDLECGWNAGVKRSLLVRTGYGAEQERTFAAKLGSGIVTDDLAAAADWILGQQEPSQPGQNPKSENRNPRAERKTPKLPQKNPKNAKKSLLFQIFMFFVLFCGHWFPSGFFRPSDFVLRTSLCVAS